MLAEMKETDDREMSRVGGRQAKEEPMNDQPHLCPLCGQENDCALANGRPIESCWCFTAEISRQALERIPEAARGVACLCASCATAREANAVEDLVGRRARDG